MHAFNTAFEITAATNGIREDAHVRLVIGVVALIAGIVGLILRKSTQGRWPKKLSNPAFLAGFGALWLIIHITTWKIDSDNIDRLVDVHRSGKCSIVEGIVRVTHEQPASGHDAGDKIKIGDLAFEVDYFRVTPGYKQTISHGGVLREGAFARLHHYNGVILQVEIAAE